MNSMIQRYLPPAIVLGAAVFFAWPPPAPLDLGDDVVRASSVRWRSDDLTDPPVIEPASDPFQEVLVLSEEVVEAANAVAEVAATGPAPEELQAGLRLDGFANMGGRTWAVVNGRPRLPGDAIRIGDVNRHPCEIVSIETDHIVVRCEKTVTKIRPRPQGNARRVAAITAAPTSMTPNNEATVAPPTGDVSPPPQD